MKVIYENSDFFASIDLSDWLVARNLIIGNITAVSFMAKINATDIDGSAVFSKTLGSGVNVSDNSLLISSLDTDFGTGLLEADDTYNLYLGVQITGDTKFREIILDDWQLEVLQDGIRA